MKKFLLGIVYFSCFPLVVFLAIIFLYVKRDVYYDFSSPKDYSWKYHFQELGDLSTKKLLHASSTKYNSFIFGSSRAVGIYACYLQTKIRGSRFFHYANWNESVGGIYAKLKLLSSQGYNLDNIFIYFDTDYTFRDDGVCSPFDHYLLTGENKYKYYYHHFKGFISSLDDDETKILLGYPVSGEIFPNWTSDPITNDAQHVCSDSIIKAYGKKDRGKEYMHKMDSLKASGFLYTRNPFQKFAEKQITPNVDNLLVKIRDILAQHHSNYYIAITPLYDQLKFAPSDMQEIKRIFGDHVYDFSGINAFTQDEYNYFDKKHFQFYISKAIIDSIVTGRQ
jgi:hypothetical protein